jgi:co-chaperonin GroES (HSP10)
MLQPIGHRILIQPDAPPEETASGLVLPQERDHIPMSGTVVAVGNGPARDVRIRACAIARCMAIVLDETDRDTALTALRRYKAEVERYAGTIAVGDRVAYPVDAGLLLKEDGTDYIVLNEEDAAVLVTDEPVAA